MSELSAPVVASLLLWGTLVGLDLVSVPQAMISRPLVAGTVAGWLVGDVHAGHRRAEPVPLVEIAPHDLHAGRPGRVPQPARIPRQAPHRMPLGRHPWGQSSTDVAGGTRDQTPHLSRIARRAGRRRP